MAYPMPYSFPLAPSGCSGAPLHQQDTDQHQDDTCGLDYLEPLAEEGRANHQPEDRHQKREALARLSVTRSSTSNQSQNASDDPRPARATRTRTNSGDHISNETSSVNMDSRAKGAAPMSNW